MIHTNKPRNLRGFLLTLLQHGRPFYGVKTCLRLQQSRVAKLFGWLYLVGWLYSTY